jgi:hypothetical protein
VKRQGKKKGGLMVDKLEQKIDILQKETSDKILKWLDQLKKNNFEPELVRDFRLRCGTAIYYDRRNIGYAVQRYKDGVDLNSSDDVPDPGGDTP